MPLIRQVTINFDNGVQKVQGSYNGSGIVSDWTESGQSIQLIQGNTIFTIILKPGYVVNSVVSTTSGEITFTDNTFSQSSSFSDTITITTSKVEINTALQNNNKTLEQTNIKLTNIKNTLNSKRSGGSGGSKVDTSDADATQSDILSGKTAYVNGTKLTGTHVCETPQTQEKTATPSTSIQEVTPDSGKYLSKVTITKPSTLTPGNIKKDIDIGGVIGTYEAITPTVTFDSTTGTLTITTSEASS